MNEIGQSWFDEARFGMFVHWGHCSQRGYELSWPLVGGNPVLPHCQNVSVDEYQATAQTFNPTRWDAQALARRAKQAGMRYGILTTKHHDGYAMFDTRLSNFSIAHSPRHRDVTREFADALRAEGLRVGFYYSLIDWHHPDYPAFTDADKPYRFGRWRQPTPEQWGRFLAFMFGQIRELLTNYGKIDLIWFDGGWERSPEQWHASELEKMIRELQPEIIMNDRLPGAGDYDTPEQFVPAQPPARRWETCLTINESWGYNPSDTELKSARSLIHTLCEVASRGGNLLLNVSPMGDGQIAPEHIERLEAFARWMANNGESITCTQPGLEPWQFYGPTTRRGDRVYLHLLMKPYETVTVRGVPIKRIQAIRRLGREGELRYTKRCSIIDQFMNPDPLGEVTIEVPASIVDQNATVIAIDFASQPQ